MLCIFWRKARIWIKLALRVHKILLNKKDQLTQKRMRTSGACLKAHCKQNPSWRILAVDIRHSDYEG